MKRFTFIILLIAHLFYQSAYAQIKYYTATGKDSLTYVATNIGLLILKRDSNEELAYHSLINDSNKVYTRALDNDNYLILSTSNSVDIYSLVNKYLPNYIGSLNITNIISIRPFGNHFALLRSGITDHLIVGVENDSLKILSSINAPGYSYTGKTAFYPEVVYPYFFSKATDSQIMMSKFEESSKEFGLIDTLNSITSGYSFVQMFGAKNLLFVRERSGGFPYYTVYTKKFRLVNDTLIFLSRNSYNALLGFTDEIECTDTLIRFNGDYTYLNGQNINEPNGYLAAYPNLSGVHIYNTQTSGIPLYSKMYYSTNILGTTIHSAQFIYTSSSVDGSNPMSKYSLYQNYPNPFNPSTFIRYQIPALCFVQLKVYDLLGNEVETLLNEYQSGGNYEVNFNANHLATGIYFYRLKAGIFVETKNMIFLK